MNYAPSRLSFPAAGARIGEFNGKNLSTVGSSMILVEDAAVPGVAEMQQWFASGGAAQPAQALSRTGGGRADRRATVSIIREEVRLCWGCSWPQSAAAVPPVR